VNPRSGRVLVLNAGSATLKAAILELPEHEPRLERTVAWSRPDAAEVEAALGEIVDAVAAGDIALDTIEAVGHRVVHGGERFVEPVSVDDETLEALDDVASLAPLHNPIAVAVIRAARRRLGNVLHVAAFDTAFHATLPLAAHRYPIPHDWVERYGIRRFGFHGLSVQWSVHRTAELLGRPAEELQLVVAHLGGGCSVTAVERGSSVHTSMGLTPLEGLMMATRAGSIDPGIVFRLIRAGIDPDDIECRLEHESGLLGVGGTDDMRRLLDAESAGDEPASLAIELFVRSAAAAIAAATTTLDDIDAIVFTGGIGEHATTIKARICDRLRLLGVPEWREDERSRDAVLARGTSALAVVRIHAREDLVIANAALEVARG
jgi:acetate kinase